MNIIISNSSGQPIYEQIASQIKSMTVSYTHLDVYKRQGYRGTISVYGSLYNYCI